ncbi:MAG: dehydrogenase E1 component subunit alpha/beta [Synoicihabitans sp.]
MEYPTPPAILNQRDLSLKELQSAPADAQLRLFAWMYYARRTDNRILELFRQGLIKGTVTGGQGNEGLIIPLTLLADKGQDVVSFTHRDLGGHLIWGGHLCEHLNQYFANAHSPTQAREGNIHHGDPANRSLPMISHLGAMLSNVIGATESYRRQNTTPVGITFFGDGGSSTGDIHESMNLASLLSVPVLFVIENNNYAYSTPIEEQFAPDTELWRRAAGYGMEGRFIDTTNVLDSLSGFSDAMETVRSTGRPMLVEAKTLRLRGHAAYDTCDYLRPGEAEGFEAADALPKFRKSLEHDGHAETLAQIEKEISDFVEACIQISLQVPRPVADRDQMTREVFAPPAEAIEWSPAPSASESLNFAQALNAAHRKILTERPESLVMGQDIATYGGAFKVTDGLLKDFGRERVFNTPLAESACTGFAIGMALAGHRPIEEFQFADFSTEATTQITLNAATYHFRSGAKVPLVLRLPTGGGLTFGSFHSQELESFFLAMPGLKALYPSTPQDAFNALLAAYEDDNPVLLFEHKGLYRGSKGPVAFDPDYQKVWEPRKITSGDFATVVTYGEMVKLAEDVAGYFADEYEADFEIFDLRALAPLQLDAIKASLARTHRLIVLHEGRERHGFGAELVAQLTADHFFDLEAPPLRIGSLDLPVPFAPELEQAFRPTRDSVIDKIADWIG